MNNTTASIKDAIKPSIQKLANMLNGREYLDETTEQIERIAKENGFVIMFGYSNDTVIIKGAIDEETNLAMYRNQIKSVTYKQKKVLFENSYFDWTFETEIQHATFNIFKDDYPFCRGIVFNIKDLQ